MIELYYLDKGVKKGSINNLKTLKNKKIWIDITNITKEEKDIIQTEFNLHPLTSEDLLNSGIRVKVEEFNEYLFSVFYSIRKTRNIELIELDFILGENVLITNHKAKIESFEKIKSDFSKLENIFSKGPDFLFHKLLDQEVDNFFPILEHIDDVIENLEEEVLKRPKPDLLTEIHQLKRKIVSIKKVAFQQREKVSFLAKNQYHFISKKSLPYFRDIYDHAIRVSDTIDNYREAIGATADAYMASISNNMNEVMKTLSIFATIALPLGIISGIFGTNFDILPGQHIPFGFWLMILLMVLFSAGMVTYFKKKNWF